MLQKFCELGLDQVLFDIMIFFVPYRKERGGMQDGAASRSRDCEASVPREHARSWL